MNIRNDWTIIVDNNVIFYLMIRLPPRSTHTDTLFPYTTLFRTPGKSQVGAIHAAREPDGYAGDVGADALDHSGSAAGNAIRRCARWRRSVAASGRADRAGTAVGAPPANAACRQSVGSFAERVHVRCDKRK